MIGQHIGYRYDVNLLPDYKKITPFLKKYVEAMGWDVRIHAQWTRILKKIAVCTIEKKKQTNFCLFI
jgi:hypothetical protein